MYFVMKARYPDDGEIAMLSHKRDHGMRSWTSGRQFSDDPNDLPFLKVPALPIRAEVKSGYAGAMLEFWDVPVPLMTTRLHKALVDAGVTNLDVYPAEIVDAKRGKTWNDYVAFNLVGTVAAADLAKTQVSPTASERMTSMDIDSLAIDESATGGALMFRLAESVNAIVVHERVKDHLESIGIDTLDFIVPENWAG